MRWAAVLIEHPWLAAIPAAGMLWLWTHSHSRVALIGAILWIAYLAWEYGIKIFTPEADMRVDLVLIYPLLLVFTLAGLWSGLRGRT